MRRLTLAALIALFPALLWVAGNAAHADAPSQPQIRALEPWLALPSRLALALESSRELCTAGTLTKISWNISGGSAPYALSIEDSAVDVSADNVRINCGALPTDPLTGELIARQTKTFRASVSDSRGVTTSASVAVTLTTPPYLAADTALRYETPTT